MEGDGRWKEGLPLRHVFVPNHVTAVFTASYFHPLMPPPHQPTLKWAQRTPHLLLSIEVANLDASSPTTTIQLTDTSLVLEGVDGAGETHHLLIDFYAEVDPKASRHKVTGMGVKCMIKKKEDAWWPRITKEKGKVWWIKTDFDQWVEEDEEHEAPDGVEEYDMPAMGGGGGGGGMDFGGLGGEFEEEMKKLDAMGYGRGRGMPSEEEYARMDGMDASDVYQGASGVQETEQDEQDE